MSMEDLRRLLSECAPAVDWMTLEPEAPAAMNSLDVIVFIARLYDEYRIAVPSELLKRENFASLNAIWRLCERLNGGKRA